MRYKDARTVVGKDHPAIEYAKDIVDFVWYEVTGERPVCTGAQEEGHSPRSLHYGIPGDTRCRAFDVRIRDPQTGLVLLTHEQRDMVDRELRARLGTSFDIVWEGVHLHIEFQPKPVALT